ncbi:MAG TPA: hypothetical protein VGK50_01600 [Coriobacteriia bacterium]|jgi:hypothetical protein
MTSAVPERTLRWLLLGEADTPGTQALWAQRNEYEPVRRILEAQQPDGSWAPPARDYQKYGGSLWQVHFLGELMAEGTDERVRLAADYAFSRQLPTARGAATAARTPRSRA